MANVTWSTGPVWTPGRGDFALASDGVNLYAAGGRVYNESIPSANQTGFFAQGRVWTTGGYGAGRSPYSDLTAIDDARIAPGAGAYFLIRALNACPGTLGSGSLGTTPSGTPRAGRSCP